MDISLSSEKSTISLDTNIINMRKYKVDDYKERLNYINIIAREFSIMSGYSIQTIGKSITGTFISFYTKRKILIKGGLIELNVVRITYNYMLGMSKQTGDIHIKFDDLYNSEITSYVKSRLSDQGITEGVEIITITYNSTQGRVYTNIPKEFEEDQNNIYITISNIRETIIDRVNTTAKNGFYPERSFPFIQLGEAPSYFPDESYDWQYELKILNDYTSLINMHPSVDEI